MSKKLIIPVIALLGLCACDGTEISTVSSSDPSNTSSESSSSSSSSSEAPLPAFSDAMLASLQHTSIAFEGTSVYTEQLEEGQPNSLNSTLKTEFTESTFYQIEEVQDTYEDITYELELFKKEDGNPYMYVFDLPNNQYKEYRYGKDEDSNGEVEEYYSWDLFTNPFLSLTKEAFTPSAEGVYTLASDKASAVSNVITGWEDTIVLFTVTVEDDSVTSMHMETAVENHTSEYYGDYTSHTAYDLTIVGRGDEVVARTVPAGYPTNDGHTALETALKELESGSYTIKHTDSTPIEGFDDVVETIYYTSEAVYVNYEDAPKGWLQGEGKVIEFTVEDGTPTLFANYNDETIADDYFPHIDFAPELLKDLGDGVYEAYTSEIAEYVASELDLIEPSASTATSLKITLGDDSHISKVVYVYPFGTVTMEYSNFGSTTIDLDFSGLLGTTPDQNYDDIPEDAFGVFETEEKDLKIELSKTELKVNGQVTKFTLELDEYDSATLKFEYEGKSWVGNFAEAVSMPPILNEPAYWNLVPDGDYSSSKQCYKVS